MQSSTFTVGHAQADARRYIVELHTDEAGRIYRIEYLGAGNATDTERIAIMNARVAQLDEHIANAEFLDRLTRVAPLGLQFQTPAKFASKLRELYKTASKEALCYVAWWIVEHINGGFVTDAQVRTAFGMTTIAYTLFKTDKVLPAHDSWAAVLGAQGE